MALPLSSLSPSKQNSRYSTIKMNSPKSQYGMSSHGLSIDHIGHSNGFAERHSIEEDDFHDAFSIAPSSPKTAKLTQPTSSPKKALSPFKRRSTDLDGTHSRSPLGSPRESAIRFNEGLTTTMGVSQNNTEVDESVIHHDIKDEGMSTISPGQSESKDALDDDTEITLNIDHTTFNNDTLGDLSTISAIPADLTRFANLRSSPTKGEDDGWSPSKQLRTSTILSTPSTAHKQSQSISQRPLQLVSRHSSSSAESEADATPRRPYDSNELPTDLLNFTGQSNIFIPPPSSAPRTTRRSPSGRGAFPIRVNPSPTHRSQASVDRERCAGKSPQKQQQQQGYFPEQSVMSTPADKRRSTYAPNGLGLDLLDIDLEPLATPRSIPTVTPRELETLRSELQSRISGLEATLSGKEAEVMALKRSITDAEVRVGKTSEDLRNERAAKEDLERDKTELEKRSREMEDVLREVKQNAFVEEREREKMRREIAESDRKVEEAEVKILELTASLETLRDDRMKTSPSPMKIGDPSTPGVGGGPVDVDAAVKQATESVARELHALYKGKHERKVADLKVSYEKRWMKKIDGLEEELKRSQDEVLRLMTERDATMSGVVPGQAERMRAQREKDELLERNEQSEADRKMLEAQVAGLEEQMGSLTGDRDQLRRELEQERIEKGELVAQVDLFLTMSEQEKEAVRKPLPESPPRVGEYDFPRQLQSPSKSNRMSMNGAPSGMVGGGGRPRPMSMLKAPAGGKFSGIPAPGAAKAANGANKYGGGYGGRGIMEGIARMGAGGRQ